MVRDQRTVNTQKREKSYWVKEVKPSKMAEADDSLIPECVPLLSYEYTKLKFPDELIKKANDVMLNERKECKTRRGWGLGAGRKEEKKTHQGDIYLRFSFMF